MSVIKAIDMPHFCAFDRALSEMHFVYRIFEQRGIQRSLFVGQFLWGLMLSKELKRLAWDCHKPVQWALISSAVSPSHRDHCDVVKWSHQTRISFQSHFIWHVVQHEFVWSIGLNSKENRCVFHWVKLSKNRVTKSLKLAQSPSVLRLVCGSGWLLSL